MCHHYLANKTTSTFLQRFLAITQAMLPRNLLHGCIDIFGHLPCRSTDIEVAALIQHPLRNVGSRLS